MCIHAPGGWGTIVGRSPVEWPMAQLYNLERGKTISIPFSISIFNFQPVEFFINKKVVLAYERCNDKDLLLRSNTKRIPNWGLTEAAHSYTHLDGEMIYLPLIQYGALLRLLDRGETREAEQRRVT